MLRERKEKTENYARSRMGESGGLEKNPEQTRECRETKKQVKLPSADLLYLNHEFDDREDFDSLDQKVSSTKVGMKEKPKPNHPAKPLSFTANYDHIQSVVGSKHSQSDLHSRRDQSQLLAEQMPDQSTTHLASTTSVISKEGMFRTSKVERRKTIEARFKNPLERDFMEAMEQDIERLTELLAIETDSDAGTQQHTTQVSEYQSGKYLLARQVENMQHTFARDHEERLDTFINDKMMSDLDVFDKEISTVRERSPARVARYRNRSQSLGRSNSPAKHQKTNQRERCEQRMESYGKGSTENRGIVGATNPSGHKSQTKTGQPALASQDVKKPAQQTLLTKANQPVSVKADPGAPKSQEIRGNYAGGSIVHHNMENGRSLGCESQGGKTKNSGFLRHNKYTDHPNNAIYEESSDNPFDKFEKNAQHNQVRARDRGRCRQHAVQDQLDSADEHAAEHPYWQSQVHAQHHRHIPLERRDVEGAERAGVHPA
jgi:hypothetical protein